MSKLVFKSPFKITQYYGVNKDYYKKFGLAGHEGIDLIPQDLSDWMIISPEGGGQVVKDIDDPKSGGAYGNTATVWYPSKKFALQFCHMEKNLVKVGDKITKGQEIGKMGATGNTSGAHLHLNYFQTDENGIRQNKDNGFLGGLDPLPYLSEGENEGTFVDAQTFTNIVHGSTEWDKTVKSTIGENANPRSTQFEDVNKVIAGYKARETELTNKLINAEKNLNAANQEIDNQKEKVANVEAKCQDDIRITKAENEALKKNAKNFDLVAGEYRATIESLQGRLRAKEKEVGELKVEISQLESGQTNNLLQQLVDLLNKVFKK